MRGILVSAGVLFVMLGVGLIHDVKAMSNPSGLGTAFVVVWGLAVLCFFMAWKSHQGQKENQAFFLWLEKNAQLVMQGGAQFQGIMITPNTDMRQYVMAVSAIVVTFKTPSRFYIGGIDNLQWASAGHTLGTLLFGWWGLPWGPVYSVQAIAKNLGGGTQMTVGELLTRSSYELQGR